MNWTQAIGWTGLLLATFGTVGAQPPAAPSDEEALLLVGADATLKSALQDLAQAWADQQPAAKVELELTNAATLERMVREGRPYDLVLLPGLPLADRLAEAGKLEPGNRHLVAQDRLALLAKSPGGDVSPQTWRNHLGGAWKKVAIGDAKMTASGQLADAIWKANAAPESVEIHRFPMDSQMLDALAKGEVDAAFGWAGHLGANRRSGQVLVTLTRPGEPALFYVAALGRGAEHPQPAQAFLDFLVSEEARQIWEKWGLAGP